MSDSTPFYNRIPFRIIFVWLIVVVLLYNFFSIDDQDTTRIMYIPPSHLVDAVVFIAMGVMANDPMVDYSIASVRKLGKWNGEIFVITDRPTCFADAIEEYDIKTIEVPSAKSIIEIKSLKPKIMSYMPNHVNGVLYIDVDILVTKNLASFFRDLGTMVFTKQMEINKKLAVKASKESKADSPPMESGGTVTHSSLDIDPPFDFAAFLDAGGHFVGFCSGCEKWHSGVLWLRRNKGVNCLEKWREILLSGKYDTDQQSLDAAEKMGACPNPFSFPTRHLLFAKDYIAMIFTSGQTFIHLTAAGRPEDNGYFYREIVVPRLQNSLHPPLNPSKLKRRKMCADKKIATVSALGNKHNTTSSNGGNV